MRIGFGHDVHKLVKNRKLILGGVEVPYSMGLLGHSDADVLVHAIMDSLLGAAAMGDIGKYFPDTSSEFKDIDSMLLLKRVYSLLRDNNYAVNNIDCTIVAQSPKLAPYIGEMIVNIADALYIDVNQVNIKATTTEKLGFEGRGEGISAYSVCTIFPNFKKTKEI